jgi:GNAT superfamily N-acetyltransferase
VLPVGYPVDLEAEEHLRDGTVVLFRPIRPDDGDALVAFHDNLSARSVYRRFFFVHPHLSASEVERFTRVDYADRMAYAVVEGERIVAVGRYEREPGATEAEVAFVVTDDRQHLGIGTLLLDHLADAARSHGIGCFTAQTLSENREMLAVFFSSGFPVTATSDAGTVTVRFPIDPCEDYARARASRGAPSEPAEPAESAEPAEPADSPRSPGR